MSSETEKDNFKILFGKNLKRIRDSKSLIFRQLATRCNIDYSDISKIEKGKRNIQLSSLLELSKGLNVHPKELFSFEVEFDYDME
ncbi:helix-turn-helix transcriptional regulator [Flavivirga abyssicola]|uniref:helix-turn-helix domain-containing protein n=1 Tax=Flavivirga abyssicola TaxID=3063533 RepID=UPI0026DF8898|nr:helix-turn-helix transcriptional regulator [Flavivirga sp. MEBiC07777]WVK14824.1 helix-turn-helix transcriptional regulator [Flavivirga sp. MEBiC07777]